MYCAILYVPYHTQTYDEIVIVLIACYNHIIILINIHSNDATIREFSVFYLFRYGWNCHNLP